MTAVGQARPAFVPPKARPWSRIYGLGHRLCQDAPRLAPRRDHRVRPDRRVPAVRAAPPSARRTTRRQSRQELVNLVEEPAARAGGRLRQPVPRQHRDAGRVDRLEDRRLARPDGRAVVRPRAVRHARRRGPPRQPRVRRHDAARHAPDRRREAGGPPHGHGHRRHRRRSCPPTSPGPRSRRCRATRSRSRRRSASRSGSGWWRWRPGRSRSPSPRSSDAGRRRAIAGAILVVGYFINGYQAAVPAFVRRRQPDLVGLDGPPPAAGRPVRLGVARPGRDRRDRPVHRGRRAVRATRPGPDLARPMAGHPRRARRPPRSDEPLAGRAPAAGGVVGDRDRPDGLHLRGGVAVVDRRRCEPVARHAGDLPEPVPEPRAQRRRRVPPAGVHHVRVDPGRVRGGDPRQRLGDR